MAVDIRWNLLPLTLIAIMLTTSCWFFSSVFSRFNCAEWTLSTRSPARLTFFLFLSTMFYPISDLPVWFRFAAWMNPMTWQVDILRFCLLGLGNAAVVLFEAGVLSVFTGICLSFAVQALNRAS